MRYYDTRYLLLPLALNVRAFFQGDQAQNSSFLFFHYAMTFLVTFALSLAFLLTSVRVQIFCHAGQTRRLALRLGRAALSVPLTLSLTVVLFIPSSAFWTAYLFLLVMSFWSDDLHDFVTRFSRTHLYSLSLDNVDQLPVMMSSHVPTTAS